MSTSDETLTEAIEDFCKRLIEGHPELPTGRKWDAFDLDTKNLWKTKFLGPLHTAAQILTKPRTVTTAEELDALPEESVVLDSEGDVSQKRGGMWCGYETAPLNSNRMLRLSGGSITVLHIGGDR